MNKYAEPKTILLVEDNDDHAELVTRTFAKLTDRVRLEHLSDGAQALDYLFGRGKYSDQKPTRPEVILLDLRLPKVDGLEVLRQLKESPTLKSTPVVVLTTSAAEADVARAYEHHANAYLVKPIEFSEFNSLLRDLGFFWLVWNKGPER